MIDKINDFIRNIPNTQLRALVTLGMAIATCVKYIAVAAWVPSAGWLTFLVGFGVIDAAQHYGKRISEHKPEEVARAEVIRKNGETNEDQDYEIG